LENEKTEAFSQHHYAMATAGKTVFAQFTKVLFRASSSDLLSNPAGHNSGKENRE
jgi:hypothetical protein